MIFSKKNSSLLLIILLLLTQACSKKPDDNNVDNTITETTYSVNNQNLLGSAVSDQTGDKILYYGSWTGNNTIDKITAIVFSKAGSDTTVTYQLTSDGDSVAYAYFSVGNQIQPKLYTFNQVGDKEVYVSIFDYNWTSGTGTFDQEIHISNGAVMKTNQFTETMANSGLFPGVPPAVTSLIGATVVTVAVVGAVAVVCPPCAAAGVTIGLMLPNNANASTDMPPPNPNNPNPTQQPAPTPPPVPTCNGVTINFNANMDSQGSIAVFAVTGGNGVYRYGIGNPPVFQTSQFFLNNYPDGTYIITVKDTSGCKTTKPFNLSRNTTTVMDIDSNEYTVVQIGNQKWLKENLKVSRYNNGDTVSPITSDLQWSGAASGAWCYYGNDAQYEATYGKLYNYYATADSRKLCPAGWHIPTDADYATLRAAYTSDDLKALTNWAAVPNQNPTNTSGFSALPAGQRYGFDGTFHDIGQMAVFWTSTADPNNANQTLVQYLPEGGGGGQGTNGRTNGISVRCIKD